MEKISTSISLFLKKTPKNFLFMANSVPLTVLITNKHNKREVTELYFRQVCFPTNQIIY